MSKSKSNRNGRKALGKALAAADALVASVNRQKAARQQEQAPESSRSLAQAIDKLTIASASVDVVFDSLDNPHFCESESAAIVLLNHVIPPLHEVKELLEGLHDASLKARALVGLKA